MLSKLKITVEKKYSPKEVFGQDMMRSSTGKPIPPCSFFEEGQEFIAENSFKMPEGFCGWAWRDLTVRFTKFDLLDDMDWPEPGVTYLACGDGVRPVIFRLER
ncbi:MAG: TIGR04076 family protein, partial [Candidatus Thorarchaeota archaeon]